MILLFLRVLLQDSLRQLYQHNLTVFNPGCGLCCHSLLNVILMTSDQLSTFQSNTESYGSSDLHNATQDPLLSLSEVEEIHQITHFEIANSSRNSMIIAFCLNNYCLRSTRLAVLGLSRSNLKQGIQPNNSSAGETPVVLCGVMVIGKLNSSQMRLKSSFSLLLQPILYDLHSPFCEAT